MAAAVLACLAAPAAAQQPAAQEPAYRAFPVIGSRLALWIIAQIHLNFAAFILGVPILFAYLFTAWAVVILLVALVAERRS